VQFIFLDARAGVSPEDIKKLENEGCAVILVDGDPHRAVNINLFTISKEAHDVPTSLG